MPKITGTVSFTSKTEKDLQRMTPGELEAHIDYLRELKEAVQNDLRAAVRLNDARIQAAIVAEQTKNLSDEAADALQEQLKARKAQNMTVAGIESEEGVGNS